MVLYPSIPNPPVNKPITSTRIPKNRSTNPPIPSLISCVREREREKNNIVSLVHALTPRCIHSHPDEREWNSEYNRGIEGEGGWWWKRSRVSRSGQTVGSRSTVSDNIEYFFRTNVSKRFEKRERERDGSRSRKRRKDRGRIRGGGGLKRPGPKFSTITGGG